MATGESGDGPAGFGYPKFRLLLLLQSMTTMAAVLLVVAMAAAAIIPLNFAATACSADHISLFCVFLFSLVNANFENKSSHPCVSLFAVANAEFRETPTQRTRVGPQLTPLYSIGEVGCP